MKARCDCLTHRFRNIAGLRPHVNYLVGILPTYLIVCDDY